MAALYKRMKNPAGVARSGVDARMTPIEFARFILVGTMWAWHDQRNPNVNYGRTSFGFVSLIPNARR